ncbi:MAG: DNA-directed DNA polymerase [Candidatus Micrarchaeota archaeon]
MKTKDKHGVVKAFLLDADHVMKNGESAVRLTLKLESGKTIRLYDSFEPYFLVKPKGDLQKAKSSLEGMQANSRSGLVKTKRVEETSLSFRNEKIPLLKVFAFKASDVPSLREEAKKHGEPFESDIPYTRRYLLDKLLRPNSLHEIEHEGLSVRKIKLLESNETPKLKMLSLDIETYNPKGMPNAENDPVLMIGFDGQERGVYSFKKKFSKDFVTSFGSEKQMIEEYCALLRKKHVDLVCTYNGDQFDLPYLQTRAKRLGADLRLGRDKSQVKSRKIGLRTISEISGRIHYDVFPVASFLNFIGTIKVERLTLAEVYATVLGGEKLAMDKESMYKIWDSGSQKELDYLAEYCLRDAEACLALTKHFLHLQLELGKLVQMPLIEVSRATASQLVETFLLSKAFVRKELAPNRPSSEEISLRQAPVEGAFVKTPEAGVYDNIAVLDFRSLYPSIIISHNIDSTTFNCDCCKNDGFVSPQGHRFCSKRKGIIPEMLEEVLRERARIRTEMKKLDKNSTEYKALDARQWGLKILANSTYGYLLYARSRWYSREGGEATTAWGRHYIQKALSEAEKFNLKPLYGDTDSAFLLYERKSDVAEFQKKINSELPEAMQLELEGFYPRGIFVSKKVKGKEEKGAKKKYALIGEDGKIKIRGFELVRRDWSKVAKDTQRKVLEILLKEGNVEKAVALVRKVVEDLRAEKIPIEDCVIYTQLRKKTGSYEVKSPELGAVEHARKIGKRIPENSVVIYVVTKEGKESSKSKQQVYKQARLAELAKNYDPDYYVNNQVLPAVLRILGALGFDEDSLKTGRKQAGLAGWS